MRDPRGNNKLSKGLMMRFVKDLVSALGYLHALGIVHRDIKTSNCLVASTEENGAVVNLKLADFGLSRYMQRVSSPQELLKATLNIGTMVCLFFLKCNFEN